MSARELTRAQKDRVLERDFYICAYCGGNATVVDHVLPYSYYPDDDEINLVASCELCNFIASNKVFDSLGEKTKYIQKEREKRRHKKYKLNECMGCGKRFSARNNRGSSMFYCEICELANQKLLPEMIPQYRDYIKNGATPRQAVSYTLRKYNRLNRMWESERIGLYATENAQDENTE